MLRKQISYLLEGVYVSGTKEMGRGVFTKYPIAADTTIEIAPVIVMSAEDRVNLDKTLLHDYIFEWGENLDQCAMALGFIPLYNHSFESNCDYEMYFSKAVMVIKTVREIKAGEELFINYNGEWNDKKPLWFVPLSPERET